LGADDGDEDDAAANDKNEMALRFVPFVAPWHNFSAPTSRSSSLSVSSAVKKPSKASSTLKLLSFTGGSEPGCGRAMEVGATAQESSRDDDEDAETGGGSLSYRASSIRASHL
jgi:hypothetical protein